MESKFSPKIGDVYMMEFTGNKNEQHGWRPGIVFQNNIGNLHSPNIIALPLTTSIKKTSQPTHVILEANKTGLLYDSMVLCENPERLSKSKIGNYITTLSEEYMAEIAKANLIATSAISFLKLDTLIEIWYNASRLNLSVSV